MNVGIMLMRLGYGYGGRDRERDEFERPGPGTVRSLLQTFEFLYCKLNQNILSLFI